MDTPSPLFAALTDSKISKLHGHSILIMPKDQQKQATSRQRPVSCRFCRTRKLRCSRTAPCSNCVSRGITCDLEHPVAQSSSAPSTSENSEIIERLHRLENPLVAQKREEQGQNGQPSNVEMDVDSDVAWLGSVYIDQIPLVSCSRIGFKGFRYRLLSLHLIFAFRLLQWSFAGHSVPYIA